jgi:hypothetical protein
MSSTIETLPPAAKRPGWWLDALLVLVLFLCAVPVRYGHTQGDLWQDEAEYALASVHSFTDHRWDRSNVAGDPERLVRLRHFHAPMTAYALRLAQIGNKDDRVLRIPFVLAGSLVVCLVYLCGLMLYAGRRDISLTCAAIVLVTPLQIRAGSHAIPWALISLGLMGVLYTLLGYVRTGKTGWLIGTCGMMGWLFCTSESFFPIGLAVAFSLPFVIGPDVKTATGRRALLRALGVGAGLFAVIVFVFWPAGVVGGAWRNIQHYAHISEASVSAQVGGVMRSPVPKWAYLYWYSHDYRPYFALYLLGAATLLVQIGRRKLSRGAGVLLVLTIVEVIVAHTAIQLGPQYLAHCLPLLTLMTGFCFLFFLTLSDVRIPANVARLVPGAGMVSMAVLVAYLAHWQVRPELRVTDEEASVSRWPDASRFLAACWQADDRLLIGPQPTVVPRWYLLHVRGLPATETQIGEMPQGRTRTGGLLRMAKGAIHYVIVNSTFEGDPAIDPVVHKMLTTWPVVYRSRERDDALPRLVIYERPPGVDVAHPLPIPNPVLNPIPKG